MEKRLTSSARATIGDLHRMKGVIVRFVGLDKRRRPVLYIRDSVRSFLAVVRPDGSTRYLEGELGWFTDEEIETWDPGEFELLCSLGFLFLKTDETQHPIPPLPDLLAARDEGRS